MNTDQSNPLNRSCMLVYLSISQWTGKRLDRRGQEAVSQVHGSEQRSGTYSKFLVPAKSLARINSAAQGLRMAHYKYTLPWFDGGMRVLSNKGFWDHDTAMSKVKGEFWLAVDEFCAEYPRLVQEAHQHLGKLFNAMDYPSDVRKLFAIESRILPLPCGQDFRVEGLQEATLGIHRELESLQEGLVEGAKREMAQRIHTVCSKMVAKLEGYRAEEGKPTESNFHASLLENALSLAELLPSLNVTGDPEFQELQGKLAALGAHKAPELKADAEKRLQVASEAAKIVEKLSLYGF